MSDCFNTCRKEICHYYGSCTRKCYRWELERMEEELKQLKEDGLYTSA